LSERFLKRAVKWYFKSLGYDVRIARIRLGNTEIDGEAVRNGERIAIEIKTLSDDLARGLGQLAEALASGYNQAVLVTTLRKAKRIESPVFSTAGFTLLAVDSKGNVHAMANPYTGSLCHGGPLTEGIKYRCRRYHRGDNSGLCNP